MAADQGEAAYVQLCNLSGLHASAAVPIHAALQLYFWRNWRGLRSYPGQSCHHCVAVLVIICRDGDGPVSAASMLVSFWSTPSSLLK